jgi:general secretion pathway protein L
MPGKVLGIDINSDSVTAVQVQGELRGYYITGCARVMIDEAEAGGLDGALTALSEQADLEADTYISSIPAEQVSYRNLRMPFKDMKKIRQTIAFSIEETVPFPVEDLVVDFTVVDQSDQSEILAASVRRGYISEYLTHLQGHGIDPDILDIRCVPLVSWMLGKAGTPDNGLVLEIGLKKSTMVLYLKRRISLIRTLTFSDRLTAQPVSNEQSRNHEKTQNAEGIQSCCSFLCTGIQNTLHAFGSQNNITVRPEKVFITGSGSLYPNIEGLVEGFLDIPVERINLMRDTGVHMDEGIARFWNPAIMDSALALALRDDRGGLGFNFRKGEFEIRKKRLMLMKEIRRAAAFLIAILFLLAADLGADYYFLKRRYRMLDGQITEIFRQTLPNVKRIVDPVQQMMAEIDEIKKSAISLPGITGGRGVLDLFRDISLRSSGSHDLRMTRMVVDPEVVRIEGETDTFNTVDIVKKGLEQSEYFSAVTISSANLDRSGKRVRFEIRLQRAK